MEITDLLTISSPYAITVISAYAGGWVLTNAFFGRKIITGKKLDEREKLFIPLLIGLLFELCLFLPPLILINFWFTLPLDLFTCAAILFIATCGGVLFQFLYSEDHSKLAFQKQAKPILSFAVFCFSSLVIFVSSLTLGIFLYNRFTFSIIISVWGNFTLWSYGCFFMFTAGAILAWIFVLRVSSLDKWIADMRKVFKTKKRSIFILMALLIIAGFALPPIDASCALATPKVIEEEATFSGMASSGDYFSGVIYINSTRYYNEVLSNFSSYVLMESAYKVNIPSFRSLQAIIIENPSNVGSKIGDCYTFKPTYINDVYVFSIDVPDDVSYKPILEEPTEPSSDVLAIIVYFNNFIGQSFWVNITYWQEVDYTQSLSTNPYNIVIKDLGNGTWMETHTLEIGNNCNGDFWIPFIDYDWFFKDYVQRDSVIVYVNGHIQPFSELLNIRKLAIRSEAYGQKTTNLTFTFLDNAYPNW